MKNKAYPAAALRAAALIILAALLSGCSAAGREKTDLMFFYLEPCASCDEYKTAEKFAGYVLTLDKKREWEGEYWNLVDPEGGKRLKSVLQEKELPDISRSLPLLIIGEEFINGYDEIGSTLKGLLEE